RVAPTAAALPRTVGRMDPGQEKLPLSNRGAALWGNLVISTANYPARVIATDKDNGKVVWETNLHDQPDVQLTAAPLAVKDKIIVGAAGGDRGVRDWSATFRNIERNDSDMIGADPLTGHVKN